LLRDGAQRAIAEGRASAEVISVPGALEIPVAIVMAVDAATAAGTPYDGVIALGCVIRGATYHFEIVAGESSRALIDLAVTRRLALGNGILTVENEAQALERADPAQGDKGGDAARAAIVLAALARRFGGAR
jgi:6,7-dimethyl-8-ribityllumazine synthase